MSQNYYQLYLDSAFALAETIVIKSEAMAELMNNYLRASRQTVIDELPATWKYYLNVSGQYHESDYRENDQALVAKLQSTMTPQEWSTIGQVEKRKILVTSLDTLEIIAFSRENLHIHKATAKAYRHGSRYWLEIMAKYPNDWLLIMGILYPADINKAIAAEDGSILAYPREYVESSEHTFIDKLDAWIKGFIFRWRNSQFEITDNLYSHAFLGVLYTKLIPAILNIRLAACKTDEVHSFHIRQYLGSHAMLDQYLDVLTRSQQLFLYRNIRYIERNYGKRDVFAWLIEHIMTERLLPVAQYTMKHTWTDLGPDTYYSEPRFRKQPINTRTNIIEQDKYTLEQVIDKEVNEARDNWLYRKNNQPNGDGQFPGNESSLKLVDRYYTGVERKLEHSLSAVVASKVLESSVLDYSNATPYTMEEVLINQWLYSARSGDYVAYMQVRNPRTGTRVPVSAYDAYLYWAYACYASVYGVEDPDTTAGNGFIDGGIHTLFRAIPNYTAWRVRKRALPTAGRIHSVVDPRLVELAVAQGIIADHTAIDQAILTPILSTEDFYNKCKLLYNQTKKELAVIASFENHTAYGMAKNMVSQVYVDDLRPYAPTAVNYVDWMNDRSLPHEGFSKDDWLQVVASVFVQSTGLDLDTTPSVRNIQKAMVAIMKQLSSYSVQWLREINDSDIKVLNWSAVMLGDGLVEGHQRRRVPVSVGPTTSTEEGHHRIEWELLGEHVKHNARVEGHHIVNFDISCGVDTKNGFKSTIHQRWHIPALHGRTSSDCDAGLTPAEIVTPGWASWLSIPLALRNKLKDAYCNCWPEAGDNRMDLQNEVGYRVGNAFYYIGFNEGTSNGFTHLIPLVQTHEFINDAQITLLDGIMANETQILDGLSWLGGPAGSVQFNFTGLPIGYEGFKPLPARSGVETFDYTGGSLPIDEF